jgi:hypothetical protein
MENAYRFLLRIIFSTVAITAAAAPANPFPITLKQANGVSFEARIKGDEKQNWLETLDGYVILKNRQTGNFEYATKNAAGMLFPSGIVVEGNEFPQKIPISQRPPKGLRPPGG